MKSTPLIALALALGVGLSCFSDRAPITEPGNDQDCAVPAGAFGRNRVVVSIRNFAFLADTVRIRAGGTVTWVNCEPPAVEPHTSTSSAGVWNSGPIAPGENYAQTFPNTGTFSYFCQPHPTMRGVVIVE